MSELSDKAKYLLENECSTDAQQESQWEHLHEYITKLEAVARAARAVDEIHDVAGLVYSGKVFGVAPKKERRMALRAALAALDSDGDV